MSVMQAYQPRRVWDIFEAICAIPHGSGNTRAISDFCVNFAREHSLPYQQDALNNVIIRKPATPGYEAAPVLILQGHLDMVCVKEAASTHNFLTDGLNLRVQDDFLYATDTTLGADNGIAVAMALAVLEDDSLPHPALEVLLTVDEETGMFGAEAVDFADLQGRRLINLDSEREGVITAGCAGGIHADCLLPVARCVQKGRSCTVTVGGLLGGHSGEEINKERASANVLLGRLLYGLQQNLPFGILNLSGGTVENAIAAKAVARLVVDDTYLPILAEQVENFNAAFRREYASSDADVTLTLAVGDELTTLTTDANDTDRIIFALFNLPYGVQAVSMDIPGLPQTSLNMGVLRMAENEVKMSFSVRSSVASQKEWLCQRLTSLMKRVGGRVALSSAYPAWEFRRHSAFREQIVACFTDFYGQPPQISATHGGLECGLFCGKAPDLDCVSIGPEMHDIHSPAEHLSISSTERTYQLLCNILAACR